jgi:LysM repeat protein
LKKSPSSFIKIFRLNSWCNLAYLKQECQSATLDNEQIVHTVESGDTLLSISERYGYSVNKIASWNQLQAPYHLSVGQRLRIFPCYYHVVNVSANDMLFIRSQPTVISQRVGAIPYDGTFVKVTGLSKRDGKSRWVPIKYKGIEGWVNRGYLAGSADCQAVKKPHGCYRVINVASNDTLSIRSKPNATSEQVGVIPYRGTGIQMLGQLKQIKNSSWAPIRYEGIQGWVNHAYLAEDEMGCQETYPFYEYYTVSVGDTLFSLSRRFGYSFNELIRWNQLQPPYRLLVGQRLRIVPCSSHVVKVPTNDMLFIRAKPTVISMRVGAIPYDGTDVQITGSIKTVGKTHWVPIKYKGIEGWVNQSYLEPDCQ